MHFAENRMGNQVGRIYFSRIKHRACIIAMSRHCIHPPTWEHAIETVLLTLLRVAARHRRYAPAGARGKSAAHLRHPHDAS